VIYVTATAPSHAASYQGITSFRWLESTGGTAGTSTLAEMLKFLEEDGGRALVAGEDGPAEVGVYTDGTRKYLRTYADGSWNNNLSALPSL